MGKETRTLQYPLLIIHYFAITQGYLWFPNSQKMTSYQILTIILDLLLLLMIALVGMYYEQFYQVTDIHTVPGPSLSDVPRPNTNAFFRTTSSSGYVPQAPPTYQSSAHPNAHLSKAHEISSPGNQRL